jgi:uncharacterized protein (DUF1499 family)
MIRSIFLLIVFGLLAIVVAYGSLVAVKGRKGALAVLLGEIKREPVDFAQLRLKSSPNQYLVCPEGDCSGQAHAVAPDFSVSVDRLQAAWFAVVESQPSTEIIGRNDAARQFDIETLTPLIGYPDTVTVRFIELASDRSTLMIYSRSHYGHSDLGANQKRIDRWLAEVTAQISEND